MKTLSLAALAVLLLANNAEAKQGHVLRGLFCNTKSQVEETLARVRDNLTLAAAIGVTNRTEVACVHAYRVKYMVIHPAIIGMAEVNGHSLTLYQATLIGVLVGENPRPVEPPLQTFFVPMDRLTEADIQSGA